jgi:hypothetical protein
MTEKNENNGNRIFLISFIVTLLVLSAAAAVMIYLPKLQTLQHIPSTYDVKTPDWFKFIPTGAEKITKMNFTKISQTTGNNSVFTSENLLELLNFSNTITIQNSQISVTIFYPNSNPNSDELALNILKPNSQIYSDLHLELENKNSQKTIYQETAIYQVTRRLNNTAYLTGYVCQQNGYLLYSDGIKGLELIKRALENEKAGTLLTSDPIIKAAFYVLDPKDELAFSYSVLPYTVNEVVAVSTKISYESSKLVTRNFFAFNTTAIAEKNMNNIKQANLSATEYQLIDNYILTTARYDKSNLLGELRSL